MSAESISICLVGAKGRMGASLAALIAQDQQLTLSAMIDRPDHPDIGEEINGMVLSHDLAEVLGRSDAVIDFSAPGSTENHAEIIAEAGCAYIVGTTGLSDKDHAALDRAAEKIPVVQAGNFSLGVAVLMAAVRLVASKLDASEWDIEILDRHHRYKVDSPSGTALMLGQAAASARGVDLAEVSEAGRTGLHGARKAGSIGFSAVRGGHIIGQHDVSFLGASEQVTLSHLAENRDLFAQGALKAARFAVTRKAGRYSLSDVLGL